MKGKHQMRSRRIGQKIGRILAWVAIISPVVLLALILPLSGQVVELRVQVDSLTQQVQEVKKSQEGVVSDEVMVEVPPEDTQEEPVQVVNPLEYYGLYLPSGEEIEIMAKILYREARGVKDEAQQAAVVWCILNRVDNGYWGDTIKEVATYPHAFAWIPDTPVDQELCLLVSDVCERWNLEKMGQAEVGRTLPREYLYFTGDGSLNHFTKEWRSTEYWDWSLLGPYHS
nr:MAG TPA: Cell Wall Hydrolase [Caudoviricetes sp.]